jgi:dCMP deaminase
MRQAESWASVWMKVAEAISQRSKDPNTQVGAVVVSPDNRQHTGGYNGFPVNIKETAERWSRPTKYSYCLHAEANAILNSRTDLEGWTLYLTLFPCVECAKMIIQSGIKKVVYKNNPTDVSRQNINYNLSEEMLKEAEIDLIHFQCQ